jgi:hypothetical protein
LYPFDGSRGYTSVGQHLERRHSLGECPSDDTGPDLGSWRNPI